MSESARDTRAELFAALQALAEIVPEMRGGQLMAAVGELCADLHGRGLWDAADAELLEAVWQFRRDFEAATASLAREEAEHGAARRLEYASQRRTLLDFTSMSAGQLKALPDTWIPSKPTQMLSARN